MILIETGSSEILCGLPQNVCPVDQLPEQTITRQIEGEADRGNGPQPSRLYNSIMPFSMHASKTYIDRLAREISYADLNNQSRQRANSVYAHFIERKKSMNDFESGKPEPTLPNRPYRQAWYVTRAEDERSIEQLMQQMMITGKPMHEMFIYLWGMMGMGKTWLLRHFQDQYQRSGESDMPYPSFSLYFEFSSEKEHSLTDLIRSIAQQLFAQFEDATDLSVLQTLQDLDLEDAFKELREAIARLVAPGSKRCFILLFDNIDLLETELWQEIENQLLMNFLDLPCVIVSTSQKQDPDWLHFEIWRRISDMRGIALQPFTIKAAEQLVAQCRYNIQPQEMSEIILPLGSGSPRIIDLIASAIDQWKQEKKAKQMTLSILDKLTELVALIAAYLNTIIPSSIQKKMGAIYPLRYYEDQAFRYMLTHLEPASDGQPSAYYSRQLNSLVTQTTLIWRDTNHKAYVTNPVVRQLMDNLALLRCLHKENENYLLVHKTASEMYWEKAKDTPKISEKFLLEVIFHAGKQLLAQKGNDQVIDEINQAVAFARDNLAAARISNMKNAIESDTEIKQILPEVIYDNILCKLEAVKVA